MSRYSNSVSIVCGVSLVGCVLGPISGFQIYHFNHKRLLLTDLQIKLADSTYPITTTTFSSLMLFSALGLMQGTSFAAIAELSQDPGNRELESGAIAQAIK